MADGRQSADLMVRWHALTLAEQLGNIGAEVGRAIRAKSGPHPERMERALERALQLFDLTITGIRPSALRELRRAREVVCDYLVGNNSFGSTPEALEKYFLTFALKARRDR